MGNTYFKHKSLHKYIRVTRPRWSGGNEHSRSGAGKERYAALSAG